MTSDLACAVTFIKHLYERDINSTTINIGGCYNLSILNKDWENRLSRDHTLYIVILVSKVVKERCRF